MLDTNMASYIIKGNENVLTKLVQLPMRAVCISVVTEAELLHGVEKNAQSKSLRKLVHEFLLRIDVLPWDSVVASTYGKFRTECESKGKTLSAMDMMIAAHAVSENMTLVTNDKAFTHVMNNLEDWTK